MVAPKTEPRISSPFPPGLGSHVAAEARLCATAGAVVGGISAAASNLSKVGKGELGLGEALGRTAVEAATAGAHGAAVGATSGLMRAALRAAGMRGVARGMAPLAVAAGVLEIGSDGYKVAKGQLSGEAFAKRAAKTAVTTGTSYAGAEVGAAIGTIIAPGLGTMAGALIGGMVGYVGGGKLFAAMRNEEPEPAPEPA
ncbi:MAG: hypothetical protein JST54_11545 [Deltaproteobacteria bacterium]|nr:hypothetical protein [Deltaproteobacteria bacterium]